MPLKLPRDFYDRPTLKVAHDLLGKVLVHRRRGTVTSGVIVEVEAYVGETDPACHAAAGRTARNTPLYGPPGHAYVYLNYGIHYLVNAVTEGDGNPAAVLIRALDPIEGIDVMRRRRGHASRTRASSRPGNADSGLCRGPGNLTLAMGIGPSENGINLCGDRLWIEDREIGIGPVVWGPRIGIRVGTDRHWRASVQDHPAVSGSRIAGTTRTTGKKGRERS
jgi:DNA-3-methyladenine glycosylase